MGDGILSPDEIDSLLMGGGGGDSFDIPGSGGGNSSELDVIAPLKNILSEASDNMGGALTAMLGQTITIGKPEISLVTIADVKNAALDNMVSVTMDFESGITGSHTYLLDAGTAKSVAGLMMGQEEETLSENSLGAVSEAMNIICGNETNSIGSKIKKDLRVTSPTTIAVPKNDISFGSGNIYMATYSFTIEGKEPVKLIELFEESVVKNIAEKVASAAAPPPSKQTGKSGGSAGGSSNKGGGRTMQQTPVQNVQFGNIGDIIPDGQPSNINLLMDVNMELTVELGRTKKAIKEILSMGEGTVIELDKLAGEPVDILVNGKLIARGEVVVIDENFGVRVTEIVDAAERIKDFS
jgi:flagellar motor switch protein FliN/FliY